MNIAIIAAGGHSRRMKTKENKIFLKLLDQPVLSHTLATFDRHKKIKEIIITARKKDIPKIKKIIAKNTFKKVSFVMPALNSRQASTYAVIKELIRTKRVRPKDYLVIHNAANPLVTPAEIDRVIHSAKKWGASLLAIPVCDTIKMSKKTGFVKKTVSRDFLWRAQTPQVIRFDIAKKAFKKAASSGFIGTDDVMLVERLRKRVKIVPCSPRNFKITYPDDLILAKTIIKKKFKNMFRVGLGQDSHRIKIKDQKSKIENSKPLILGGVLIDKYIEVYANSDGDVVLHALFNALSSSVGKESISKYADPICKEQGITDSREYLKIALDLIKKAGYKVNNVSIAVEAKQPKVTWQQQDKMKKVISKLCRIEPKDVGITFTSGEDLTPFGKSLGIQAYATVIIKNK